MANTKHILVGALILAVVLIGVNVVTLMSDTPDAAIVETGPVQHVEDTVETYGSNTFDSVVESVANTIETTRTERIEKQQKKSTTKRQTAAIEKVANTEGKTRVIVKLKDSSKRSDVISTFDSSTVKIRDLRDKIVVEATTSEVAKLLEDENVEGVVRDLPLEIAWDEESFSLVKLNQTIAYATAQGLNITGAGQSVCVIDSGLEINHGAFNNENLASFGNKVAYGYNYYNNNGNWDDENGHGTSIAGIIAGNSTQYTGMLPEARVVVMKVTDSAGQGWSSYLDEAVQDCIDNRTAYDITTIVIPLRLQAPDENNTPDLCVGDPAAEKIWDAIDLGMNVIAPSGNDGRTDSIAYPAVCENVTSVAGVWDYSGLYDTVWTTGNRQSNYLDMLAPSRLVYAPGLTDSYGQGSGTSNAAAIVAGATMILEEVGLQKYGVDYTPEEIRDILTLTGDSINDPVLPVSFPRLNIERAIHHETIAPTISLDTTDNSGSDSSVELKFTPNDAHHELTVCEVYVDGVLNGTYNNPTNNQQITHTTGMSTGAHTWYVQCFDNATFSNAKNSSTYTISVDDVKPIVTLVAPPNATIITNTNKVNFSYSVDDWNSIDECDLNIDTVIVDTMFSPNRNATLTFNEQTLAQGGHTWYVSCTDAYGNTQTMPTFTLTIDVPTEPTISGLPDRNVDEDTAPPSQWIDLHAYANDPDNASNTLIYTITSETNSALISCSISGNQYFTCSTPASDQSGTSDITIEVSDGVDTDTDTFTVTVDPVNDAPQVSSLPNQNLLENSGMNGDVIDISNYVTDVDGPVGNISCAVISESHPGVVTCSVDANDRLDCDVQPSQLGSSTVTVEVTDSIESVNTTVVITVGNVNDPPVMATLPAQNVDEDGNPANDWIDIASFVTDPDNASTTLFYTITSETNSALIDCSISNGHYLDCANPTADQFGTSDVTIEVDDGEYQDSETVTITVNPINDAPVFNSIANQPLLENSGMNQNVVDLETYASDVETSASSLTYTILSETATAIVDCSIDGSNNLDCDVQNGQTGTSTVTVQVSDGSLTDTEVFDVIVQALPNQAPSITNLPDSENGTEGSLITFDVDATDPEADPLTFSIVAGLEPGMSIDPNTGDFSWTPTFAQSGTYNVDIEVSDGSLTDTETLTITVADVVPTMDFNLQFVLVQSGTGTQSQSFSYLLKNTGTSSITSFDYNFWDGIEANHTGTVTPASPIQAGKTYVGLLPITYTITGSGTAELTIDPLDNVLELDENNNQQTVGVTVN